MKSTITNDDTHLKENFLFFSQIKFALTYYQLLSPAGTVASSNKLPKFFSVEIFGFVTNECSWIISKSSLAPFTNWKQVLTHCIKNCCATGPTIIKKFSKKGPLRNKLINDRQCSCFMIYLKAPEQYFWIMPFFCLYYYTKWNFEYF